jgi:hypothetical protein
MRLAKPLQADGFDTFSQTQKGRLHVLGQRGDLGIDDGSQGLNGPCHGAPKIALANPLRLDQSR